MRVGEAGALVTTPDIPALRPRHWAFAEDVVPQPNSVYRVGLARPDEYDALETMSLAASRDEVKIPLRADTVRWLVEENPVGPGFVVVARRRDDGRIVGHFLFYPKRMLVRDGGRATPRTTIAFLYVALYVSSELRRGGIFTAMMRFGFDLLRRGGIECGFTVPNPRSAPGFLKLGDHLVGRVPFWVSPGGWKGAPSNALSRLVSLARSRSQRVEAAEDFDSRHAELTNQIPDGAIVCGARALPELRWRYVRRPGVHYQVWNVTRGSDLLGYAVTRRMHIMSYETTVVCDLWTRSDTAGIVPGLLARLRRHAAPSPPDLLVVLGSGSPALGRPALLGSGMCPAPQRLLPQPVALIGGNLGASSEEPAWLRPASLCRWVITPYDWDVF